MVVYNLLPDHIQYFHSQQIFENENEHTWG